MKTTFILSCSTTFELYIIGEETASVGSPTTTTSSCNNNECCYYNQEWFNIGENITEIILPDGCTIIYLHCAKNNKQVPKIMMEAINDCVNGNDNENII